MAQGKDTPASPVETAPLWDSNPLVLISKRNRNFYFPGSLLLKEPTQEDLAAWTSRESRSIDRDEKVVSILAGVTFLGCWTSCWELLGVPDPSSAPRAEKGKSAAPPHDKCVLVFPDSNAGDAFERPQFRETYSRALIGSEVHKAWKRVFKYLKDRDSEAVKRGELGLWTPVGGYDCPEVQILPLQDVLEARTEEGQKAIRYVLDAVKFHRNSAHLGALHDYAVRHPRAWDIVTAARVRHGKFK